MASTKITIRTGLALVMKIKTIALSMRTALVLLAAFAVSLNGEAQSAAQAAKTPVPAAGTTYAITGAKVHTLAGPPLENATVVIREGKIAAVGREAVVPPGAQVIDAKGLEVYPGLFNPATQMGLAEISSVAGTVDLAETGAYNPEVVAATAVHPASAHIPVTRANGITHVITAPGLGGGVIGGQASAIHLAGWTIDEMLIRRSAAMVVNWPTMETRTFDPVTFTPRQRPFTEVKQEYEKQVNELADWLERARHYAQAMEKGSPGKFARDLKLEAVVPVVQGKLPVLVVARRARDIRNAVEFCEKQKLKMILGRGTEAWKVKDLLKKHDIPVLLQPTQSLPFAEDDPYDKPFTQPAELAAAGIKFAFASFDTEFMRRVGSQAGIAAGYGLPREEALKAVTLYPAQIFGLADQLGTIEPGKVANLIVTNGDPLEIRTEVRYLFIRGQLTSTDNRHQQLYEEYRKRP